jgi:hypothetical protein
MALCAWQGHSWCGRVQGIAWCRSSRGLAHRVHRVLALSVRFFLFCSISIILLASLVAGRRPQCTVAGNILHHTYPLEYQTAPASPGRSRVGPALYVYSLLGLARHAMQRRAHQSPIHPGPLMHCRPGLPCNSVRTKAVTGPTCHSTKYTRQRSAQTLSAMWSLGLFSFSLSLSLSFSFQNNI